MAQFLLSITYSMAKKKNHKHKISFQDFVNSLERADEPRMLDEKIERQYFLVVTEGEKTEPNYFKGLTAELPDHLVAVEIIGEGANTISVVEAAIKKREVRKNENLLPNFDEVWVVFDKDDFPAKRFNGAIQLANNELIKLAYSNEAFELWYILHFQYLDAAVNRTRYIEILKGILGNYQKNNAQMYQILKQKGDETKAILWAKKLFEELNIGNPSEEKPTTLVYRLVERLNDFKK